MKNSNNKTGRIAIFAALAAATIVIGAATLSQILQPAIAQSCDFLCKNQGYIVSNEAQTHDDAVDSLKAAPGWDPNGLKATGQEQGDTVSNLATGKIVGPD